MTSGHSGHGAGSPGQVSNGGTGHGYHEGRGADAPAPSALPYALKSGRMTAHLGDGPGHTDGSRIAPALKANAKRPTGRASVPNVPKPALRSLPAWDIGISDGEDGDVPGKDYMVFSANVWNSGPAPLVVDGFRTPGKDLMDAYQYFHDAAGKQVGYSPTGTMEWDPRVGHEHWHFTDFASYRLLRADQKEIVRSGKEAFCLANTDGIDLRPAELAFRKGSARRRLRRHVHAVPSRPVLRRHRSAERHVLHPGDRQPRKAALREQHDQ